MGDHRDVSWDSRGHRYYPGGGSIPESAVVGRAFIVIWPLSQWTVLKIPSTFDQPALNSSAGQAPASEQAAAVTRPRASASARRRPWSRSRSASPGPFR